MMSNLPPGCSSDDGGIDHAWESAAEKILDLATADALDAEELVYAMMVGIEAVKMMRPLVSKYIAIEKSFGPY